MVELMQPEIDEAVSRRVGKAVDEAVSREVGKAVDKAVKKTGSETWNLAEAKMTMEAIDNAMRKLGMSKKDACAFMDTTPEQYNVYRRLIKNIQNTVDGDREQI